MGHTRVDLKRPWKMSTMMESFLLMWFSHASSATTWDKRQNQLLQQTVKTKQLKEKRHRWSHFIGPSTSVLQLDIRFLSDAVQVFVKPVQEKGQQLMGVLLLVAGELGRKAAHLGLEDEKLI